MKTAIITGASSGIGEVTAKALAENGFNVVLIARREALLVKLRDELEAQGHSALVCPADITDRNQVKAAVGNALEKWGRIDVLINNAGIMPLSFMKNLHEDEWDRMIDVNIKGVLNGIGAVLPAMQAQNRGHIINVSSVAGIKVMPTAAVYCGTKFAVEAITEGLRQEFAMSGTLRTTVIRPGAVATNLMGTITDPEVQPFLEQGALGDFQFIQPKAIADAIVFAVNQPLEVSVNEVVIRPTAQPF
ncbi:MAG: SDR family oxidoreductase [Desulfobacterium sp.]|nr:SDR family oxidoreductase [Desulfobacterium sp.]